MDEIRIYFEGAPALKPGFAKFFEELRACARAKGIPFRPVAGGGRVVQDFGIAIRRHRSAWNILLKDSEGPLAPDASITLCRQQHWDTSHADSIFWMVEMMESWFHADKEMLGKFYRDLKVNALKPNPNVEEISKRDLELGLKAATKDTTKGTYHKTAHAPKLLEMIRPEKVRAAAPNCDRFFRTVSEGLIGAQ